MRRILITGMSGTGKSSVVGELVSRGYRAVDTDDGWCEPTPDGRQRWREDAMAALLADDQGGLLLVAGCEENQGVFHPLFDRIILLSAPADVMVHRLSTRTTNPFGRSTADRHRVLDDLAQVEPLLRRVADHEIDTTRPLGDVVDEIEALARQA